MKIVNARKQATYWQFDFQVNQDVVLLRLRYYPASERLRGHFIKRRGFVRPGQERWLPVIKTSEFFKKTLHRLCREKWGVQEVQAQ